jgi:two-component system NtrC family sensor kinase
MKKNILLIVFYLFSFTMLMAQATWPPVYEIKSDTAAIQTLDNSFWQKLEDKDGKWTIDEVSKLPLSVKFHAPGLKAAGTDTSAVHAYWQRYRLKNTMDHDAKIALSSGTDYFDVYITGKDTIPVQFHSGLLQDWNKKDGLKHANTSGAIPVVLRPGEEVAVYDRRERKGATNFNITVRLWNTEKLIQEQYINYVDGRTNYFAALHLQEAFVLGLLLLAIFLNLLFYRIVHEKVYLYFALFALFLGLNRLWNISHAYSLWQHPAWLRFVPLLGYAWAFIPFFLIQFFREFLKTKITYPRWDKVLFSLGILNIIVHILIFLSPAFLKKMGPYLNHINSFLPFFLIPLCILVTLLLFARKKDASVRYVVAGAFPLLLLYLLTGPSVVFGITIAFIDGMMNNFRLIEVICISWLVLSFSLLLLMRFDRLRKENAQQALENEKLAREKEMEKTELIEKQKAHLEIQVAERTADLERSIDELKSTQSQLIQSEKMASLGELTAGIAHEIQNPLNFVNNFSEVNTELIDELKGERQKVGGERNTDLENELLNDIEENERKINHHGKRADAIVKGMLQHSRQTSGIKEPTDINALCDEYLRLGYHGLRAKDKSFNATMKTDFDESIGNINVIPQDIGRVLLNLYNNAFYAVNERKKNATVNYEPTVTLSTRHIRSPLGGQGVEIKVIDNGGGIPQKIIDKIFQPFFTTKPTGQGTGLGLSLAYDIVKAHGGELKVETVNGKGAVFVILIPI